MDFTVTILGSSSAVPLPGRHQTSQLLQLHDSSILLDCGEAAQLQLMKIHGRPNSLEAIFISHLHPDHYLGLMGLLSTLTLRGRQLPLTIAGPDGLEAIIETQRMASGMVFPFAITYQVLTHGKQPQIAWENQRMRITTFDLQHRIPCFGYLVEEKITDRPINKHKLRDVVLAVEAFPVLKKGQDYTDEMGNYYPAHEFTLAPPPPRRYAYATDTLLIPGLADTILRGVDMLYHEATYLDALRDKAQATYHTTAAQAANLAHHAGVSRLLLGHFSARYTDLQPFLDEARPIFPATFLAEETQTFAIDRQRSQ